MSVKIPVAVEMYSLRNILAQDFVGTLKAVKSYGYDAVEFAGVYPHDAKFIADALKEADITCCSWHVGYNDVLGSDDKLKETIEFHKTVGNDSLIVPWLPTEWMNTIDAMKATGEKFNKLCDTLKQYGMSTGYHNHDAEFKPIEGSDLTIWSAMRENTCSDFIMQLDTGNALSGGADVNGELLQAAGRSQILHLKPYSLTKGFATMIGDDDDAIDYPTILNFCKEKGGTRIYVIEYECEEIYTEMEGVRIALDRLKSLYGDLL
jgi:Sugar phosphate isomerases/epimerases